jgi:hypothetical protein
MRAVARCGLKRIVGMTGVPEGAFRELPRKRNQSGAHHSAGLLLDENTVAPTCPGRYPGLQARLRHLPVNPEAASCC